MANLHISRLSRTPKRVSLEVRRYADPSRNGRDLTPTENCLSEIVKQALGMSDDRGHTREEFFSLPHNSVCTCVHCRRCA